MDAFKTATVIVNGAGPVGLTMACEHSPVRHGAGMDFEGGQYEEEFLLADVKVESDLPADEAHLFLSHDGLAAYFPSAPSFRV